MDRRPNIVLVMSDQQHRAAVGAYGVAPSPTPNVDRIAAGGMRFDHAYCCSAVCSPSRAALFTGRLPHRFGPVQNNLTIPDGTPTLAGGLREAGYRLAYSGKWHVDKATLPTDHGFEGKNFPGYGFPAWMFKAPVDPAAMRRKGNAYYEYLMDRGYPVPTLSDTHPAWEPQRKSLILSGRQSGPPESSIPWFVGEEGVQLAGSLCRRRKADGQPFFLWMNFWGPHNPCYVPEPYYSMFNPADIARSGSLDETFAEKPVCQKLSCHYWGMRGAPWSHWQKYLAAYLGYCAIIDAQVGRLRRLIEDAGEWDNTLFIYSTDHGDMLGRHQMTDKGPYMYDDIYRIPLVVQGPGVRAGVCDELVYLHDLFATILDSAGAAHDPDGDGRSLRPLLGGASGWTSRAEIFGEFEQQIFPHPQRMIRTRTRKLVYNAGDLCELYDLERDPDEMTNRINDPAYAGDKRDLLGRLTDHLKRVQDPLSGVLASVNHAI